MSEPLGHTPPRSTQGRFVTTEPCYGCGTPCERISINATHMETGDVIKITAPMCPDCEHLLGYLLLEVPAVDDDAVTST